MYYTQRFFSPTDRRIYPRYRIYNNIIIYIVHFVIRLDRNVEHDTTVAETWNIILRARHDDLWSDFTRILQPQRTYDNATPFPPSFRPSSVTVLAIFYHLFIDLIICFVTISSGSRRTDNATAAVVMDPYGVSDHVYDYMIIIILCDTIENHSCYIIQ